MCRFRERHFHIKHFIATVDKHYKLHAQSQATVVTQDSSEQYGNWMFR